MLASSLNAAQTNLVSVSDKWILSSALQKLIRRGMAAQSIAAAIRLHQLDPAYLRKRLPIVVLEDIGLADLAVCRQVLEACSSAKFWGDRADQTIVLLISTMASALKSRAACDAFCLTEVHLDRVRILSHLLKLPRNELIDIACDEGAIVDRLYALRVLGGIRGDNYETISRCDLEALGTIAQTLRLPYEIGWLMARQPKTEGLAAMLPIVYELSKNGIVCEGTEFPNAMDFVAGVPLCSLDQYTRVGKAALREFYGASEPVRAFTQLHVRGRAQPLINLAMFQVESCVLDRFLSTPALDHLKKLTDDAEMVSTGMGNASHREGLYDLLRAEADRLAEIRVRLIRQLSESA